MEFPDWLGMYVIGQVQEKLSDSDYKAMVKILTGPYSEECCPIMYKGDNIPESELVMRLTNPISEGNLKIDYTARFINRSPPEKFDYAASDRVILYSKWEKMMQDKIPSMDKFNDFFDPGITPFILFYIRERNITKPYLITPSKTMLDTTGKRRPRSKGAALNIYLKRMHKGYYGPINPRVILCGGGINFNRDIKTTIDERYEDHYTLLHMEPQRYLQITL
jgi:hypothetical protein